MRRPLLLGPLALALGLGCSSLACQGEVTAVDGSASESDEGGESSGDSPTSEGPGESETDTSPGESETGEPEPSCGDGVVDPDEECDDGNAIDDDACTNACESPCQAEFWISVTAREGWFDVQAMGARPPGGIELAGAVDPDEGVGTLRDLRFAGTELELELVSAPLWPPGTVELPQTHEVTAVALTEPGDLLALGRSTEVLAPGEDPVESYWLARFTAEDLAELWRVSIPAASPEQRPLDLAALQSGDAIVTSTVEVDPSDDDILVRRLSFADGSELWSTTLSGAQEGGWSLDRASHVAVGAGDLVWVAGIVRVDWQTYEATLFELDPGDGSLSGAAVPLADPGSNHEQEIRDLAAGPAGQVAIGLSIEGPASQYDSSAVFMYDGATLAWSLVPEDLPWEDGGPYLDPRVAFDEQGKVLVTGTYTHSFPAFGKASRAWAVELAPDGTQLCSARLGEGNDAAIVPDNGFFAGGRAAINLDAYGPGGMGPGSGANWLVGLRGW